MQREYAAAAVGGIHLAASVPRNAPTLSRPRDTPNLLKRGCVELKSYPVLPRHHDTHPSARLKAAFAKPAAVGNEPRLKDVPVGRPQTADRGLAPHAGAFY